MLCLEVFKYRKPNASQKRGLKEIYYQEVRF